MKINNKILISLLIVLIAAVSLSAVSATDSDIDTQSINLNSNSEQVEAVEVSNINMGGVISADNGTSEPKTIDVKDGATIEEVQEIIDNSNPGDIIKFAENGKYNWHGPENQTSAVSAIKINHQLTLDGNNATITCDNGFATDNKENSVDGTIFKNFNFDVSVTTTTDSKTTTSLWNGRAIEVQGAKNISVMNCNFKNGNSGIYSGRNNGLTIDNCSFVGATDAATIGSGKKETGTKAIAIMGGSNAIISNCYFGDDLLDGVSIASGAQNNFQFLNNTFENVWYGVFYGGGVRGVVVEGNTFKNSKIYDLGLVKAAGETKILNNTFITSGKSNPVYIEQGNTAHGAPSTIETITITNNIFKAAEDTDAKDISAVYIFSQGGPLLPLGTITVANNTYDDGITPVTFMDNAWGGQNNTYIIAPINLNTEIKAPETEIKSGETINMQLITANGIAIANANLTITATNEDTGINETFTAVTDNFGVFGVDGLSAGNWILSISYAGSNVPVNGYTYNACKKEIDVTVIGEPSLDIKETTIYRGGSLEYTLTDENGNPIENATISITINGVTYNRTTNENGTAKIKINLKAGNYAIVATYKNGNDTIKSAEIITVQTNIITNDIKLYFENGTSFTAKIVDATGKAIANKNVTFNINGVFYNRPTDENGVASLKINLRPGTYIITTMYDIYNDIGNTVEVLPTLQTSDLNMTFQDGSKFTATVVDGNGTPMANQNVTFNVNGVFYHKVTDENGVASLTINLNPGKYIITSQWNKYQVGNNITINA